MTLKLHKPDTRPEFSEANFRRFERDIHAICERNGQVCYTIKPLTLSPSTYVANFRSVMRAFLHPDCKWPTYVDRSAFYTIIASGLSIDFNTVEGTVTFKPKHSEMKNSVFDRPFSLQPQDIDITHKPEVLNALCLLKNHNVISDPVSVVGLSDLDISSLQSTYPNISFASDGPGRFQIF